MPHIDPRELNELALFAAKGGLGRGIATTDCVAQEADQLMFITGDELVLLRQLPSVDIASCEGVVGWVHKGAVHFDPVASSSLPLHVPARDDLPRTVLTAPSPPTLAQPLPDLSGSRLDAPKESKRISSLFEFETPQTSPGIDHSASTYFDPATKGQDVKRDSASSVASSAALGGIGGFMMGDDSDSDAGSDPDPTEHLRDEPAPKTEPVAVSTPRQPQLPEESTVNVSPAISQLSTGTEGSEWDIYDDYARESMYAPFKRSSVAPNRASTVPQKEPDLPAFIPGSFPGTFPESPRAEEDVSSVDGIDRARAALEGRTPSSDDSHASKPQSASYDDFETPKAPARDPESNHTEASTAHSLATQLRMRIQKERSEEEAKTATSPESSEETVNKPESNLLVVEESHAVAALPPRPRRSAERERSMASSRTSKEESRPDSRSTHDHDESTDVSHIPPDMDSVPTSEGDHTAGSIESASTTNLATPYETPSRKEPYIAERTTSPDTIEHAHGPPSLLASPLPIDDAPKEKPADLGAAPSVPSPNTSDESRGPSPSPMSPHGLVPHPPAGWSPVVSPHPHTPWTPSSPASPHSIAATRQAVDAVRKTPEGRRPRGLTLVGRMEADLSAAKGPVPISFLVGGPNSPSARTSPSAPRSIGLGLPSMAGRKSPKPEARARSPLSPAPPAPVPQIPDDFTTIRSSPSRFPTPARSVTGPSTTDDVTFGARPGFQAARPRSKSFSATMAKAVFGKKDLTINTSAPPVPSLPASPAESSTSRRIFGRKTSTPSLPSKSAISPPPSPGKLSRASTSTARTQMLSAPDSATLPSSLPPSARSASFSFSSKSSKTPRKTSPASRALPSPVSHKDYEDTVNAEGMDFELVQPKKTTSAPQSPLSPMSTFSAHPEAPSIPEATSSSSLSSKLLPETDEWGFVKDRSPVPDIYMSRAAPGDHRAVEQKWLSIISSPLPSGGAPKKVRKLATESGIPASLRGKVWAWFMSKQMSARQPGLYAELCSHERPSAADEQIDHDVATLWSDHSVFFQPQSPGRDDLRSLLRAYSNFSPSGYSTPLCQVGGTLLIHCVVEDAFWLLSGFINFTLKDYYIKGGSGLVVDAGVFEAVIKGSEKDLAALFRQSGVKALDFIERWYTQLFVRCLPWPTTLRVIDAVVSEGPRFLFITALTILTLSRERLLALPKTKTAVLGYLLDLPQDSLLLPDNFMKATEKVRFREEDWKRLRTGVEKEMGL